MRSLQMDTDAADEGTGGLPSGLREGPKMGHRERDKHCYGLQDAAGPGSEKIKN